MRFPMMRTAQSQIAEPRIARSSYRRLIVAGTFGTAIEWYDFFVYALIAPLAFDAIFFPRLDPLAGAIAVYSSFAIGFVARPLGGVFFGHFGDRAGRKSVLLVTILLMGFSTTTIGLLPGYASIGLAAPILLVLLRFLQGFALGGESIGAVVLAIENAPSRSRGFYASVLMASGPVSIVAASAIVSALSAMPRDAFISWGWRIPFLLSFALVGVGAYMRAHIEESALFSRSAARQPGMGAPVASVLRKWRGPTLTTFVICLAETAFFYLTTIFAIGYGARTLGIAQGVLTTAFLVANCIAAVMVPTLGALSDRVGRRPLLLVGLLAACVYIYPFFRVLEGANPLLVSVVIVAAAGFIHPVMFAAESSFVAELFPTAVRFTGASLGKQVGTVLGGGMAPVIATSLIGWARGSTLPVVVYFLGMGIPAVLAAFIARETAKVSLEGEGAAGTGGLQ
jgi:MFS family permease